MKKAISKLRQCFSEHIDDFVFIFGLILVAFGLLLGALAVAVMVSDSATDYLQPLLREKYEVLKIIGFGIAGVVSIWLAWAANKRANAMDATAKNTEAGQRQERLKNAIEHLGHKSDSVRMGGAYELFHLAKDTGDLRQTVLNILCAHIRQTTGEDTYKEKHEAEPSEEIQSLLTLLFVQKHDVFQDCSIINLQGIYLNGATLSQARLKKADLRLAQLQGAILLRAQLQGAFLWGAKLQGADLWETQLQGANLRQAQLQGADLSKAQLQEAVLMEAQLQGTTLWQAQLQDAILMATQLQGVSSQEADHFSSAGFESRIRDRIGKHSDLTGIIFAGGLKQEDLDVACEGLSDDQAQAVREELSSHVGKPVSNELPENSSAVTTPPSPPYTQEEAEQWIAEYQEAMRKVPKRDDG